jgi:hypothetical protein
MRRRSLSHCHLGPAGRRWAYLRPGINNSGSHALLPASRVAIECHAQCVHTAQCTPVRPSRGPTPRVSARVRR